MFSVPLQGFPQSTATSSVQACPLNIATSWPKCSGFSDSTGFLFEDVVYKMGMVVSVVNILSTFFNFMVKACVIYREEVTNSKRAALVLLCSCTSSNRISFNFSSNLLASVSDDTNVQVHSIASSKLV